MTHKRLDVAAVLACVVTAGGLLVVGSGGTTSAGSGRPSVESSDDAGSVANQRGRLPRIRGSVGPGSTISVSPRRVEAGTYRFVVQDQSVMHNWHIRGEGVNRKTGITFIGTKRFTADLSTGRYRIRCDAHPSTMRTRLRVTSS